MEQPTPDTLSTLMEFDWVIQVHEDGTVTERPDVHAPSLLDTELDDSSWSLMNGYSGQWCYPGPIMHNSEFIGGRMARDILKNPGLYVSIISNYSPDDEDDELYVEGWAVAYKDA